jgi:hypothetical protein
MKISIHAAERFLERVFLKSDYSSKELGNAIIYLEKLLKDVIPNSYARSFPLPGFEEFRVIHKANTIITIIPK